MTASTSSKASILGTAARAGLLAVAALSLAACGGKDRPKGDLAASKVTTIGVNSYLWRASLEALSFMPLLQTDSNGGVIVTETFIRSFGLFGLAYQSVTITPPLLSVWSKGMNDRASRLARHR